MPRRSLEPRANQSQTGWALKRQKRSPPDLALLPCCRAAPSLARQPVISVCPRGRTQKPASSHRLAPGGLDQTAMCRSDRLQGTPLPLLLILPQKQKQTAPFSDPVLGSPRTRLGRKWAEQAGSRSKAFPAGKGSMGSCGDRPLRSTAGRRPGPTAQTILTLLLCCASQNSLCYVMMLLQHPRLGPLTAKSIPVVCDCSSLRLCVFVLALLAVSRVIRSSCQTRSGYAASRPGQWREPWRGSADLVSHRNDGRANLAFSFVSPGCWAKSQAMPPSHYYYCRQTRYPACRGNIMSYCICLQFLRDCFSTTGNSLFVGILWMSLHR